MAPTRSPALRRTIRLLAGVTLLAALAILGEAAARVGTDPDRVRVLAGAADPGARAFQELVKAQTSLGRLTYAPDPELGALLAPSLHDSIETEEYRWTLVTDHAGFPNPEPWPDRVDVAVLGNSLLIGPGLGMAGQFTTLLGEMLGGRTVLNLGLPGGGPEHELLTWRRYAAPRTPRLVVATIWAVWDIDNAQKLEQWKREGRPDADYTHYRMAFGDTHLDHPTRVPAGKAEASTADRTVRFLRRQLGRSRLLTVLRHAVRPLADDEGRAVLVRFPDGDDMVLSNQDQDRLAQGMSRPGMPDLEDVFFTPLERLRAEVEAAGARFVVALIPCKEELYGAEAAPEILRSIEAVRSGLEQRGLPTLDLYPAFAGRKGPPFYFADMHLNALGNRIAAETIAAWVRQEGVLPPPVDASGNPGS